jgi:non-specific serine/threonine protein kinase
MEEAARPAASHPSEGTQESFGTLLRNYRLAAGLTQEELAERAGLSVPGLSALESGKRQTPYRHTVTQLATALSLSSVEAARLQAAVVRARPSTGAASPAPPREGATLGATLLALLPEHPAARTNLPVQPTSFIGREREQADVLALLSRAPLVTLTGAGGCGKTRLALAVADLLLAQYPDGVWLVELAALADPALVPQTIARMLGLQEQPGRTPLELLTSYLKHRRLLLVVDNCEHLIGACADLAATLLRNCPQLRLLATSREALEVAGEALYRVPSLSLPDLDHLPSPDRLTQYEAVQLFQERAQARRADFTFSSRNAHAVAQICIRLDGMPLAIELAAARIGVLPVETIALRLDDRFRLLTGGPRDAVPRQQTLRATLDWSHDLLNQAEQVLLQRLAVFSGGWTLEAAEAVCAHDVVVPDGILDLLGALVNKSLVQAEDVEGSPRYQLLETVRQYGLERLVALGEEATVREAHLSYFLALAVQALGAYWSPEQDAWCARLEADHDNLRAALRWSLREDVAVEGTKLAYALAQFWYAHSHLREGRGWLEAALVKGSAAIPALRARLLFYAGILAWMQGAREQAWTELQEGLALCRTQSDQEWSAYPVDNSGVEEWSADMLTYLGAISLSQGDVRQAQTLLEEGLALNRRVGKPFDTAESLRYLGDVALMIGDYGRAEALYEEGLALIRKLGYRVQIAYMLIGLGKIAKDQGDYGRAWVFFNESLELRRLTGTRHQIAISLAYLGLVALEQGEHGQAEALLRQSLALQSELGARLRMADCLEGLAALAGTQGRQHEAAWLLGTAAVLREAYYVSLSPSERAARDRTIAGVRAALGEAAYASAWADGRALPLEDAVALALEHGQPAEHQAG